MIPVKKTLVRFVFALFALVFLLTHFIPAVHAQSSLGIGAAETALPSSGMLGFLMNWVNAQQQSFYRALTGALRSIRDGGDGMWVMIGISFAYGVFHAAGPGHGKAVISSYMLANEVALRRGVMLSFVSSMLQALTAIAIMTVVFLLLRGTSVSMTDATRFLEIASYALVTGFGALLLWRKAGPMIRRLAGDAPAHSLSAAHAHHDHGHHHHAHDHDHDHHHAPGEVCSTCGHSHAPDPALISGERFDWRTAWAAIVAVGLRPCTGALIVLSFAFLNGLWFVGVVSVFAMALGTAITVSALAVIAVTAKNWAVAISSDGRTGNVVHNTIEIGGAAFVFLLGLTLLIASLSA
ncbi:nickel/cobalt transporter [Mesorhizobium sp. CAU 1741]|uniref:nickel/cobalt transporter n=1 Tax=Mesorhizobium sp. CAU 1741 TaxID=3140366 RepID=UPI00325C2EBE